MNILKIKQARRKLAEKLQRYRASKKQRGVTLLEIIIVLGIIGTITAGVVVLAQRAYDSKAITDLITNTNTVRTAIKDAYGPSGIYPAPQTAAALALTDANIQLNGADSPIGRLILLGKVSATEAKNNISNNFFNVGGANLGTGTTGANKAYFIELNGLSQTQCRNLLTQVGNDFDYVQVVNNAGSGTYTVTAAPNLMAAISGINPVAAATGGGTGAGTAAVPIATVTSAQGIFRSLATGGGNILTPDGVIGACEASSSNGIVLGSR